MGAACSIYMTISQLPTFVSLPFPGQVGLGGGGSSVFGSPPASFAGLRKSSIDAAAGGGFPSTPTVLYGGGTLGAMGGVGHGTGASHGGDRGGLMLTSRRYSREFPGGAFDVDDGGGALGDDEIFEAVPAHFDFDLEDFEVWGGGEGYRRERIT